MKTIAKTLLYFTRSERSGITVLAALCLLFFWFPTLLPYWRPAPRTDFSEFQQEIAAFYASQSETREDSLELSRFNPNTASETELLALGMPEWTVRTLLKYREKGGRFLYREDLQKIYNLDSALYEVLSPFIDLPSSSSAAPPKISVSEGQALTLRPFDPNLVTAAELENFGVPARVAQTWANYRNKGGMIRDKEDLQKIYGMSAALYEKLAPYLRWEATAANVAPGRDGAGMIDINQADETEWRTLLGIGPALSARIVKFRDKLGGFVSVGQVAETYGLPDSTFQVIAPQLTASPILRKMPVNQVSVEELQAHPYLNWRQAKAIVNYRMQHGPFKNAEDWDALLVLKAEERARLLPYLSFD